MTLSALQGFFLGTLRGRLIIGVALVHAAMMTLFIVDLTGRQRALLLDRQEQDAKALAQTLSTSAAAWLAANDIAGLQELVEIQRRYPELIFAILTDGGGHILAHTEQARRGQYLHGLPSKAELTVISKSAELVDVAAPALLGGRLVGWVRVGIGQAAAANTLAGIIRNGVLYALAAIVIGSVIAWRMGRRITKRLYAVQETINAVRAGDHAARSMLTGSDEAALLAREFNAMLDTLAERDAELRAGEENFRSLIENSPVAIAVTGADNALQLLSKKFIEVFGYTIENIPDIGHWWPLAYPEPEYRAAVMTEWFARVEKAVATKGAITPMEATVICKDGAQRQVEFHMSPIGSRALTTFIDITDRKQAEEKLKRIEWMLSDRQALSRADQLAGAMGQWYGDLTELNRQGIIRAAIGQDTLMGMMKEYQNLLETSGAVYEKNGDYALGIFTSKWCRMLDSASRRLCRTDDNGEALRSGKWLCHESRWSCCAQESIAKGVPVDTACHGGIRLYSVPILAGDEVIGSINVGYGDPPRDSVRLREIAGLYQVDYEALRKEARAYDSRPPYIVEMAKKHLQSTAKLIGELVGRKRAEEELRKLNAALEERVMARTAELEKKTVELENANKLFVGRELRMIELKKTIQELEAKTER